METVLNQSQQYSQDANGLLKAINDYGGMAKVDEAMTYLNKPMVRMGLSAIGMTPQTIQEAYQQLQQPNIRPPLNYPRQDNGNEYRNRLSKYK